MSCPRNPTMKQCLVILLPMSVISAASFSASVYSSDITSAIDSCFLLLGLFFFKLVNITDSELNDCTWSAKHYFCHYSCSRTWVPWRRKFFTYYKNSKNLICRNKEICIPVIVAYFRIQKVRKRKIYPQLQADVALERGFLRVSVYSEKKCKNMEKNGGNKVYHTTSCISYIIKIYHKYKH